MGNVTHTTRPSAGTPARDLPVGMIFDVVEVLRAHGLEPNLVELMVGLVRVIDATPESDGGRKVVVGEVPS